MKLLPMADMDFQRDEDSETISSNNKKRRKPGIIYLSTIPSKMNVSDLKGYFSKFGQIDRVYFQTVEDKSQKRKKKLQFSEGWIEFKSKRKAKLVEATLNNEPVGGKKSNPHRDILWNIKYLPRFKWAFLNQRLEYERQTFRKRMSAEISQVNKETDHYMKAFIAKNKKKTTAGTGGTTATDLEGKNFMFTQKLTDEEIQKKKKEKLKKDQKYLKAIKKKKKSRLQLSEQKEVETDDFAASIFVGD